MSRSAEVLRILERYLVEVVERHELCPWARGAREQGELAVGILWGAPTLEAWIDEAERLLALPETRVAMVIAPELEVSREGFRALRDDVAARIATAGVADFYPSAALDLATPPRLVPFLRRSPDPMLQLVPLALLDSVRTGPPPAGLAQQAAMLSGRAEAPRADIATRIALANRATTIRVHAEISATLDDITGDRRAAYARVGITSTRESSPDRGS